MMYQLNSMGIELFSSASSKLLHSGALGAFVPSFVSVALIVAIYVFPFPTLLVVLYLKVFFALVEMFSKMRNPSHQVNF